MAAPTWESTLGEYVGARRKSLGLSHEDVAAALACSAAWVASLEAGRHALLPSPHLFRTLSEVLRIEPLELLSIAGYVEPSDTGVPIMHVAPIIESITDAFFALDREWRFSFVNHQAEVLLQRKREEMLGHSIWDVFPDAIGSTFYVQYHSAMETGTSVAFEDFYPPLESWFEVHVYPSDEGLAVVFTNINERKRQEAEYDALLTRERRARARAEAAAERTATLQSVSAALSEALEPPEVARVVVEQGIAALDARAGAISLVSEDGSHLLLAHAIGYDLPDLEPYRSFLVDAPIPASEVVRTGTPIWFESAEDWDMRYPHLAGMHSRLGFDAAATIPLVVEKRILGQLSYSFGTPRHFGRDERLFVLALAQQCAQAIDRSRLYAAERAARAEAEAQRARLHDLFMQAPALIVVTRGPDHVVELANPQFMKVVGHRDLVGKPSREGLPELAEQGYITIDDEVYRTGETFIGIEMETRYDRDGDGVQEDGFFNFVIQPTHDRDGTVDGLMIHAFEVTEQVQARREAERLAREQVAILGHITDGIMITDADGRTSFVNSAGQLILGVSVVGVPIHEHPDAYHVFQLDGQPYPPEQLPLSRAVLKGETVLNVPVHIRRPDGVEVVLEASATPLADDSGRRAGAVATFRDITAQHDLARQKDDFLAAAAHDLRTPLTTIKGLAQLLRRRAVRSDDPQLARLLDDLQRIDATADRMNMLINRLLDLTRLQMNQPLALECSMINLVPMLRRIIDEQQHVSRRHRFILHADQPELVGLWDGFRLERAFTNLLSNATKYSPGGGDIVITARQLESEGTPRAVVAIQDHGVGIPPDAVPHIFERFYRAQNATEIPGVGIGLAGTQQIVAQHGGTIEVDSAEGVGTTMTVHLPIDGTGDGGSDVPVDRSIPALD
ncbi:MAG: hypothetical protein NVS2B16_11420 [Chloroflexota bacterium]